MKLSLTFGLIISFLLSIISFTVFLSNYEGLVEWKFYASLGGFVIFFLMFLLNILAILYTNNKKDNNNVL
jgi:hypothetical protein